MSWGPCRWRRSLRLQDDRGCAQYPTVVVVAYLTTASTTRTTTTTPTPGHCQRRRDGELLHAMTAATAAPVSRPPRWACQAMLGTTNPMTALIAMVAYMPAEDRPRWRLSTSSAP